MEVASGEGAARDGIDDPRAPWYAIVDGELEGPLTLEALVVLLRATRADEDTPVWRDGVHAWRPRTEVPELAGVTTRAPERAQRPRARSARIDSTILPPDHRVDALGVSSGSVDLRALWSAARVESERAAKPSSIVRPPSSIAPPPVLPAAMMRGAAASGSPRSAWMWRAAIGGACVVALALAPSLASIARAPAPVERLEATRRVVVPVVEVEREIAPVVRPPSVAETVIATPLPPAASPPVVVARRAQAVLPEREDEALEPTDSLEIEASAGDAVVELASADEPDLAAVEVGPVELASPAPEVAEIANEEPSDAVETSGDEPAVAIDPEPAAPPPTLDRLLESAVGPSARPARDERPSGADELEETPSRDDIDRGIDEVRAEVTACGASAHGIANVRMDVSGATGRVTSARVDGALSGTPAGSCVARAVRSARFARFARPSFTIQYPFRI